MPGIRTPPKQLTEAEFNEVLAQVAAILVGAAYILLDLAIALAMSSSITGQASDRKLVNVEGEALHRLTAEQRNLPRIEAAIGANWVQWAAATHDNWTWMMARFDKLAQAYTGRFNRQPPWASEVRHLWMFGPRPRAPGLTTFPEELC